MALSPEQPFNGQRMQRIPPWNAGAYPRREMEESVSVCTVNVGTLVGKSREVVEMLTRRRVDIRCLQEVRYKTSGTTSFGSNYEKYKLWYYGNDDGTAGVGILIKQYLAERVLEVVRTDEIVIKIKVLLRKLSTTFTRYMHHNRDDQPRKRKPSGAAFVVINSEEVFAWLRRKPTMTFAALKEDCKQKQTQDHT